MKPSARYLSLDVWRGLACLMVVLDHAGLVLSPLEIEGSPLRRFVIGSLSLALGPPMFFVISGYCIAASLESLFAKGKSSLEFLLRRLWRTFPPYWAALALVAGIPLYLDFIGQSWLSRSPYGLYLQSPAVLDLPQWVGNLTLTEGFRPRFWGHETNRLLSVTWTLGYQEQFYLVCFAVAALARGRLHKGLAIATVGILLFRWGSLDVGFARRAEGLFPDYWHEFAIGVGVHWRLNAAKERRARLAFDLGLAFLTVFEYQAGRSSTASASAFGLVMVALRPHDAAIAAVSWLEPIRACGRRCYSVYLAHLPVLIVGMSVGYELGLTEFWTRVFVVIPVVSAACVAGGWLFYALVESRFIGPPRLPSLPRLRFARRLTWRAA